ncbi:hypothetical protein DC498_19820 [Terrimonas sp.]|nr:hypothetical protein DC498_19820 [Terrimonas sp.]
MFGIMKKLLMLFLLFAFRETAAAQQSGRHIYQTYPITIDTLFTYINTKDDVINITVSNPTENKRQLVMEIVAVEEENSYWGTIYSAAINEDSYFFKQWRQGRKMAEKMNIKFILPRYNKLYQSIEDDEAKDFSFTISGKPMQKGMPVRLRITATDNNETVYSPVFYLHKQPE